MEGKMKRRKDGKNKKGSKKAKGRKKEKKGEIKKIKKRVKRGVYQVTRSRDFRIPRLPKHVPLHTTIQLRTLTIQPNHEMYRSF